MQISGLGSNPTAEKSKVAKSQHGPLPQEKQGPLLPGFDAT